MSHRFLHLDVFTDRRLEGNQLAVVFNAHDLPSETMQAVAREMAFSETVFVLPAEEPQTSVRLRIFTPGRELPMAGHPTIGSAFALAHEKFLRPSQFETVFGLGVGPTRIGLEWAGQSLAYAWMSQPLPTFGPVVDDVALVAQTIGVPAEAIDATGLPVELVSCGVPFLFVPLVTRAAVDRAWADAAGLTRLSQRTGIADPSVFVFSLEPADPGVTAYSRMFAPLLGVAEDPATGSASGPLGCYLVHHGAVPLAHDRSNIVSLQGVKMRRRSRVVIAIDGTGTDITGVRIGGTSVLVAEGTLHLG
jgi:trans-2,3-dihydro-3-hydroxyanthranilate isomerase